MADLYIAMFGLTALVIWMMSVVCMMIAIPGSDQFYTGMAFNAVTSFALMFILKRLLLSKKESN